MRRGAMLAVLAATALGDAAGAQSAGRLDARTVESIDRAVAAEMAAQRLVGVSVGLIAGNRIVLVKGYGYADLLRRAPASRRTMFRWASISKPVTAIAALQLAERGQLDLDADVRRYVPEFPDKGVKITTRQLLCHQGGIVHYTNGLVIPRLRLYRTKHPFENVVTAVDRFSASPLVCRPGTRFSYSTHGYILVSAVVERAGRQKFADQVTARIARPLGMKTMRPDYQWKPIAGRAVGYKRILGVILPSTNTDVSWKLGGGGFISTVGDLTRFALGLMTEKLVKARTRRMMWTRQRTSGGKTTSYGLGFVVSGSGHDLRVAHSGSQEKARTLMVCFPGLGIGVCVMSNCEYARVKLLARRLLPILRGLAPVAPRPMPKGPKMRYH